MNKYIFKKNFPWHEVNKANKNARHNHPDSRNHLEHINTPSRPFQFFFFFYNESLPLEKFGHRFPTKSYFAIF